MTFNFMPCPDCGVPVEKERWDEHECRHDQWVDHQVLRARAGLVRLEHELAAFLETAEGKFELWYAEHTRNRGGRPAARRP